MNSISVLRENTALVLFCAIAQTFPEKINSRPSQKQLAFTGRLPFPDLHLFSLPGKLLALKSLSQNLLWGKPKPIHWPPPISSFLLDLAECGSLFLRFPHFAARGPSFICQIDTKPSLMLSIIPHPVDISPFSFSTHHQIQRKQFVREKLPKYYARLISMPGKVKCELHPRNS